MEPHMAYDRTIAVFSPDGRLFQVEYAREAVRKGTPTVGIKFKEGVILMVDKRITSRLVEPSSVEKIFKIDEHIGCTTSGIVADARVLVERARMDAQINKVTYDQPIEVETLVKKICDFKQTYTQYGGVRPFGTAFLIGGVDDSGPRLFSTDPCGSSLEYKASSKGLGESLTMEYLEKNYGEEMSKEEAIILGLKALEAAAKRKLALESIDIGVVDTERKFRRLTREEISEYAKKAKI
jgi:proteasome alpha subunit